MKLAIVHDYLNQYGGAEKVVEAICEIFPDAPIYTSIYSKGGLTEIFAKKHIFVSFMQHLPFLDRHFKKYFLLYPLAFRSFDLSGFDCILTSSSGYAKGIKAPKGTLHICYCHTPARFIWDYGNYMAREDVGIACKRIIHFSVSLFLKKWDLRTARDVDYFIANSYNIAKKIHQIYGRTCEVIFPPVDVNRFYISDRIENFYLVVSRLNAYKRIDVVINVFNSLKLPLKIIGRGEYKSHLQAMAGPTIDFLDWVDEKLLAQYYAKCKALIFPGEEDFGIIPLEAAASGRPVIAFAKGGALETVIDTKTGIFFKEQTPDCLIDGIKRFQLMEHTFDSRAIREHARTFDKKIFINKIKTFVETKYGEASHASA